MNEVYAPTRSEICRARIATREQVDGWAIRWTELERCEHPQPGTAAGSYVQRGFASRPVNRYPHTPLAPAAFIGPLVSTHVPMRPNWLAELSDDARVLGGTRHSLSDEQRGAQRQSQLQRVDHSGQHRQQKDEDRDNDPAKAPFPGQTEVRLVSRRVGWERGVTVRADGRTTRNVVSAGRAIHGICKPLFRSNRGSTSTSARVSDENTKRRRIYRCGGRHQLC